MKFNPITQTNVDNQILETEYRQARQIGNVRLGETCLMFKSKLKNYYIPYSEIKRCFRRIMGVNIKMCCGKGELQVENLVISDGENELAVIQLPGKRAAVELMKDLKKRMPDADFSAPKRDGTADGASQAAEAPEEMEA